MGNGKPGEDMNENLAAVYNDDTALEMPASCKTGKSLVTLKDRAVLNVKLLKEGPEKITEPTRWINEESVCTESGRASAESL